MRQGLAAVLLCVLLAGAGCSGVPGIGGDGASYDAETANSVAGIDNGTLENESALLDAHVEAVTETGYAQKISANLTDAAQGETVRVNQEQRTAVAAGATEYRYKLITEGRVSSVFVGWGNESLEVLRGETGGGDPQYQKREPKSDASLAGRSVFERRLSSTFEVTDVRERDGKPDVVTLRAEEVPEGFEVFPDEVENVREFSAELRVDTRGRIHSYDAAADYDVQGETADYEYTFQMTSFEDPGVEQPPWVEEAAG